LNKFEAAAVTGGSPIASIVGNVTSDAPPTIPDSEPPIRPAPNSMRMVWIPILILACRHGGLVATIHVFDSETWMPGTRPGMTAINMRSY
jgi:hypothetical protein